VTTAPSDEPVSAGACVQAAAAFRSTSPLDVIADWGRPPADPTPPLVTRDVAAEVRRAYAAVRDHDGGMARPTPG
jgi:hypothetical protein